MRADLVAGSRKNGVTSHADTNDATMSRISEKLSGLDQSMIRELHSHGGGRGVVAFNWGGSVNGNERMKIVERGKCVWRVLFEKKKNGARDIVSLILLLHDHGLDMDAPC